MTRWQKIRVFVIAVAALALVAVIAIRPQEHKLRLAACFDDVRGLQAGAGVQISGVDVGQATSVQAHPDRKECSAEVNMILETPYSLAIPSDAVVRIETGGLLGPEIHFIDVRGATGPPLGDNARLKTVPTIPPLEAIRALVNAANAQCAECDSKLQRSRPATKP
jgi:ABC-type transporter Mla subunit MlaD